MTERLPSPPANAESTLSDRCVLAQVVFAECCFRRGRLEEAAGHFVSAVSWYCSQESKQKNRTSFWSDFVRVWHGLGIVRNAQGLYDEAAKCFLCAITILKGRKLPGVGNLYEEMANVCLSLEGGKLEEASDWIDAALLEDATHSAWTTKSKILALRCQWDRAATCAQLALAAHQAQTRARVGKALCLATLGEMLLLLDRHPEAESCLMEAKALWEKGLEDPSEISDYIMCEHRLGLMQLDRQRD